MIRAAATVHICWRRAINLKDLGGMRDWISRIKCVPDFYIEEVVKAAVEVGLESTAVQFCSDYLKDRRDRLEQLIRNNVNRFPCVRQGSMTF